MLLEESSLSKLFFKDSDNICTTVIGLFGPVMFVYKTWIDLSLGTF